MIDMKERLHTGELYFPGDEEIMREQMAYQDLLCEYNLTKPSEGEKRAEMLKKMLGDCGEGVYIEAPFYSNFGGHHCHFGRMVYANYHLTCVGLQYNMPVHIGRNCWIGAGAIIMPGVTIGDNVVIGAGSIVTRDIPSNVVAVGNPCRVMREIGERDRKYYFKDREIDLDEWNGRS